MGGERERGGGGAVFFFLFGEGSARSFFLSSLSLVPLSRPFSFSTHVHHVGVPGRQFHLGHVFQLLGAQAEEEEDQGGKGGWLGEGERESEEGWGG